MVTSCSVLLRVPPQPLTGTDISFTWKKCLCVCASGERSECGEGWPPAGGQHDPAGRQQSHGESCHGCSKPRAGGHGSEEG